MNGNARLLNEAQKLETKWARSGLLEGINDPFTRKMTSVLYENQFLYNELNTGTDDIANFKRISIPLVRRVFPQLIANKIVSVQPLLGPAGLVYYLRYRYSSDKGATRGASNNGGFPGDDANTLGSKASGDANLDIFYSSSFIQNETSSTDDGGDVNAVYSPLEHTPVLPGTLTGYVYDGTTAVQSFTTTEAGVFQFTDIGSPTNKADSGGTNTINLTTGEVKLTWNNAPGENHLVVSYDYNMECNADLPEINMSFESENIVAKPRKLKAGWSFEAQQDLRSQYNIDAEQEITNTLATEINLEIDREIITDLRQNAGTVSVWDYNTTIGDTVKEKYESLYVKLSELSATVHRKTLRGGANWIVCSPEVASMFETATAGYAPGPDTESFTNTLGIQYVGSVSKKWKIYKDPLFQNNQLVMGYKGDSYMDSGYFFCPYVPLTQTPTLIDPDTLCPKKGLITRYGKKLLNNGAKFYCRLSIANFYS